MREWRETGDNEIRSIFWLQSCGCLVVDLSVQLDRYNDNQQMTLEQELSYYDHDVATELGL